MGTAGQFYSDVNLKGAPDIHCPVEETCIRYKSRAQAKKVCFLLSNANKSENNVDCCKHLKHVNE